MKEAKEMVLTTSNRAAFTRARWSAVDCIERARAALDEEAQSAQVLSSHWSNLDALVRRAWLVNEVRGCYLVATAIGDKVDANSLTPRELKRLLEAVGIRSVASDSLVDALLDWRDADDESRPLGAEMQSYAAIGGMAPRNGPLRSPRELLLVRGFRDVPAVLRLLSTEPARINLAHAPVPVLLTLPGFTPQLAEEIVRRRAHGRLPSDVFQLAPVLSRDARDSLMSQQSALAARMTIEPDGWILESRGRSPGSQVTAVVEVMLARVGTGTQVLRRREWWE